MHPESDFWIAPNWLQIWKIAIKSWFPDIMSSPNFFWHCFVSLINFSYWSKFHVGIITGSGVSFYKRLTTNPEIWNTPVWDLPNIFRLGQVRVTKFGKNVSNKMLLHAAQCQGYSCYHFWVIKGKPYFPSLRPWEKLRPNIVHKTWSSFICFNCLDSFLLLFLFS